MTGIRIAPIRCSICSANLGEFAGKICTMCRRRVCPRHFLKAFFKRRGRVCSKCLAAEEPTKHHQK